MGHSTHVSSGSWDTAMSRTARLTAQNASTCPIARRPDGQLPGGGARVRGVDVGVDDPVQGHRERPRADHREQDPAERRGGRDLHLGEARRPRARTAARRSCARSARTTAGRAPARAPRPAEPPLRSWSPCDVTGGASAHGCGDRAAPGTPPSIGSPGWMEAFHGSGRGPFAGWGPGSANASGRGCGGPSYVHSIVTATITRTPRHAVGPGRAASVFTRHQEPGDPGRRDAAELLQG